MISLILSILIAFAFGYVLIWYAWPLEQRLAWLFILLAIPTGWALTSVLYFFYLVLSNARQGWYQAFEITLLVSVLSFTYKSSRNINRGVFRITGPLLSFRELLMLLSLLICSFFCFAVSIKLAKLNPWGYWDAWSRINVKANFLFAGDRWTWIFSDSSIPHKDYPLLLPCTLARCWTWIGDKSLSSAAVVGIIWGILSLLILFGMVAWLCNPSTAAISGLAYLSFTPLLFWASAQYADLPLTCYMLLSYGMLTAAEKFDEGRNNFMFLGGLFAGSAAWCKNEGIAFLFVVTLWWAVFVLRQRMNAGRMTAFFLAGGGIVGSAVLVLKGAFASKTDLISGQPSSWLTILGFLTDGERHKIIISSFLETLHQIAMWPMALLCIALVLSGQWNNKSSVNWRPLASTITMAIIYYLIFLITPLDIKFHVGTAMDRLMLQLWPLTLFSFSILLSPANPKDITVGARN